MNLFLGLQDRNESLKDVNKGADGTFCVSFEGLLSVFASRV